MIQINSISEAKDTPLICKERIDSGFPPYGVMYELVCQKTGERYIHGTIEWLMSQKLNQHLSVVNENEMLEFQEKSNQWYRNQIKIRNDRNN